ncbi:hypothetical protein CVT24_007350 [Panaeolus cyanescens]|uniref:Rrn9 domain-containing protein n=1 Tax=Panaeolus cyanescens TaxID=181874 RepID=A0A409W9V6_9AGAR|nr:hypothetical protein CVT24_007350 [Panaeolus cyanescens]
MDPASFQPGSAPNEYQVQVLSSTSSSSIHLPSPPSRPSSRLGFNAATASLETSASITGGNPAGQWDTRPEYQQSLNRDGDLPALRLSSPVSGECTVLDRPAASCSLDSPNTTGKDTKTASSPATASSATVAPIKSNSTDNDCLYGREIDRASSSPASAHMSSKPNKPRSSSPPSVSRLCFPFNTSASKRKKAPAVPPPTRHKYSCHHPTMMAPYHTGKVFPVQQRHQYSHHGHSRHGIERLKAFWSERLAQEISEGQSDADEDQRSKAQARLAALYDMDHTVVERPATIHPLALRGSEAGQAQHQLPPMTIHPRRGDIMALRDPYCVQIDQQFVNLPTWTIGKTIWMQDLHIAAEKRRAQLEAKEQTKTPIVASSRSSDSDTEEDYSQDEDSASTDAESEIDVETSLSTGFSDDSDATLVENESDIDLPQLGAIKSGNVFYQWASEGSSSSRRPVSSIHSSPAASSQASSSPYPISTSSSDVNFCSLHPSPLSESSHESISDTTTNMNINVRIGLSSWPQTFYASNSSTNSLVGPIRSSPSESDVGEEEEVLSMTPPTTPTAPKRSSTPVQAKMHNPAQPWQTNWYRRWELLVDLTKREREHQLASPCSCPATPTKEGMGKGHKFFLSTSHSDDEEENDALGSKWRQRTRVRTVSA